MNNCQYKKAMTIINAFMKSVVKNGEDSLTPLENKTLLLLAELANVYENKHYGIKSFGKLKEVKIVVVDPKRQRKLLARNRKRQLSVD